MGAPWHIHRRHPLETMIGNCAHSAFVASFEPRDVGHALSNSDWVNAMHEELENFEQNQVWVLVPPPPDCHPIGTKWVFKNKQSEDGVVVRNKARLVAQGFCQKEGIDYKESFACFFSLFSLPLSCFDSSFEGVLVRSFWFDSCRDMS